METHTHKNEWCNFFLKIESYLQRIHAYGNTASVFSFIHQWLKSSCIDNIFIEYSSDTYFHWFPVMDQIKSKKTDCSNPHQNFGLIKIQFWWSRDPFFLQCHGQACYSFSHQIQASAQHKRHMYLGCRDTLFWLKLKRPCYIVVVAHNQSTSCFVCCKAEPKVTSRSKQD